MINCVSSWTFSECDPVTDFSSSNAVSSGISDKCGKDSYCVKGLRISFKNSNDFCELISSGACLLPPPLLRLRLLLGVALFSSAKIFLRFHLLQNLIIQAPITTFARDVRRSWHLDKHRIQGQIVSDRVLPCNISPVIVRIFCLDAWHISLQASAIQRGRIEGLQ